MRFGKKFCAERLVVGKLTVFSAARVVTFPVLSSLPVSSPIESLQAVIGHQCVKTYCSFHMRKHAVIVVMWLLSN